jgi:hypothetical protein
MRARYDQRAREPGRHPFPRGGAGLLAAKIRPAGAPGPRVRGGSRTADSLNTLCPDSFPLVDADSDGTTTLIVSSSRTVIGQGVLDWLPSDQKAFRPFPADEIVVAVRPDEEKGFVESLAIEEGRAKTFVRRVCRPPFYSSTSWSAHTDSHGADVRFGHPCAWGKDGRKAI